MTYRYNDRDREEYERWHRMGRERGWFDKTRDEVASWFGDDEAERRRRRDHFERERYDRDRFGKEPMYGRSERNRDYDLAYEAGREIGRPEYEREWGRPIPGAYPTVQHSGTGYGSGTHEDRFGVSGQRFGSEREFGREWDSRSVVGTGRESEFYTTGGSSLWNDVSGRQNLVGRGPKNYRRNDERILDDIHERLDRHPEIDAREVEIEMKNGEVTLKGTVCDRRHKRMIEDIADTVYGVKNVHNTIRVEMDSERNLFSERSTSSVDAKTPIRR